MVKFANILFSGPCTAHCPFCIGRQIDPRLNHNNLDEYPPRGLERFIELVRQHRITELALTGSNTDPQAYRHEARLIERLRAELPGVRLSLHTNGRLALQKITEFNRYDRASVSLPSFDPDIYRALMGVAGPPDLERLLALAHIPVKLSCVLAEANQGEIGAYLERCQALGVRRAALRKLYGDRRPWAALLPLDDPAWQAQGEFAGAPVYRFQGLQVTLWDFEAVQAQALNLFSSGLISSAYHLVGVRPEGKLQKMAG
ncbi:MAG: radical SAM protein [Chloroflexota bacterium]